MSELRLSRKVKIFLGVIFIFPFIVLFWIAFGSEIINPRTSEEVFLELRLQINCEGVVKSIYRQKMNHNVQALKTEKCIFQVDAVWEDSFLVGDSISKKEGELFVEHYRNGELIEILDYRDIAKERKNDSWGIIWRRLKEKINIAN